MRNVTNKILEMIDDGLLDARTVALACMKYMSEDDVEDMAIFNEFLEEPEEDEEEFYPYIINAGDEIDDLCPLLASESKEKAIDLCKGNTAYKYFEVVYMPEDDLDTNEVVYRSWED